MLTYLTAWYHRLDPRVQISAFALAVPFFVVAMSAVPVPWALGVALVWALVVLLGMLSASIQLLRETL